MVLVGSARRVEKMGRIILGMAQEVATALARMVQRRREERLFGRE